MNIKHIRIDHKTIYLLFFSCLFLQTMYLKAQETTIHSPVIEEIQFTGNTTFTAKELLPELPFAVGTAYSRTLLLEGKYYISAYYADRGYKYVQVSQETYTNESTGGMQITYIIKEGIQAYIGQIKITGNSKTSEHVIRREVLIQPGDLYRRRNIYITQSKLNSLGFFEEVRIEEVASDVETTYVDLNIKITERKTGMISFGGGFSTEEGIRGFARYRQSNLFGLGKQFSAGVKWSERGQAFQRSREIRLDYFDPHLMDSDFGFGMESYYRQENLDNYALLRIGGDVSLTKQLMDNHTQGTLKYQVESDKTFNIANSIDSSVIAIDGQTDLITKVVFNITRDTRDNITYPTHGIIISWDMGVASQAFLGDLNFIKTQADARWYIPLIPPKLVLALRASAGYEDPFAGTKDIPIYERFFSGGADSVRGFGERYLGPKDLDGYPKGGRAMLLYNAELRFPIYKSFTGVVFYDSGNVWETFGQLDPTDVEHSVGAGIRYQTPIGPIRLDYGIRVPTVDNGRFHLSVGQTF